MSGTRKLKEINLCDNWSESTWNEWLCFSDEISLEITGGVKWQQLKCGRNFEKAHGVASASRAVTIEC